MYNKFKVKKKVISIALALALATQPLTTLPMNVFAGTGKNGVYTLNGLKIKNTPSKKVQFFKSGAEICALKLEGVPAGKTVIWTVIKGEDIATVDSNGVVRAKGTKGGKVSVSAKCDGMITGCSFEIGCIDLEKIASTMSTNLAEEDNVLVKSALERYCSMSLDEKIAQCLDFLNQVREKEFENFPLEIVELSVDQAENFSLDEILGDSTNKMLLLKCPKNSELMQTVFDNIENPSKPPEDKPETEKFPTLSGGANDSLSERISIVKELLNFAALVEKDTIQNNQKNWLIGSCDDARFEVDDDKTIFVQLALLRDYSLFLYFSNLPMTEITDSVSNTNTEPDNEKNAWSVCGGYFTFRHYIFDHMKKQNLYDSVETDERISYILSKLPYTLYWYKLLGHDLLLLRAICGSFAANSLLKNKESEAKKYEEIFLLTNCLFED